MVGLSQLSPVSTTKKLADTAKVTEQCNRHCDDHENQGFLDFCDITGLIKLTRKITDFCWLMNVDDPLIVT